MTDIFKDLGWFAFFFFGMILFLSSFLARGIVEFIFFQLTSITSLGVSLSLLCGVKK